MNEQEKELVDRALKGNSAAFGALVDLYWQKLSVFVYQKLKGATETQDIVQETFIKAYRRLRQLRKSDNFVAWLYKIAARLCTDHLRERVHKTVSLETVQEKHHEFAGETAKTVDESVAELLNALQKMPEKYREVVILRFIAEFSCKEISHYLDEREGTIRSRLFRANALLRTELKQTPDNGSKEKSTEKKG